jgi:transposase
VVEGIIYRLRTGIAWRDLPEWFGPHQTVSKRHRRFSADGTWDRIHARLVADAVIADKAYSSTAIRTELRSRRIKTVIPQPSDQIRHRQRRGSTGGRPPTFDAQTYKRRNVIERSFNDHQQWRGLATRYDKLARVYRGGVVLRAITLWLRE